LFCFCFLLLLLYCMLLRLSFPFFNKQNTPSI
jgi:hypothetical protein